ncbi:cytochrome P450 [Mycena belliarum]|uniref:Cytochrome P450 n=1 Tax=Mycena belliarum TaxID=1033014 RepID=A0AAD6U837_9AGAR|nr:cytochrome P450 [Mycena belliae]
MLLAVVSCPGPYIPSWAFYAFLILAAIAYTEVRYLYSDEWKIPTFNDFPYAGTYIAGLRFYFQSRKMIFGGYKQYKATVFKVPRWSTRWAVIVTGDKLVEELHRLPDNVCSLEEAAKDEMQVPHTMGPQTYSNPYHLSVLKANLHRHTDYLVNEILDEVVPAFEDVIGKNCSAEWSEFNVNTHVPKIVSRIFNRILVGAPLCQNADFNEIGCRFSVAVYITSVVINFFPLSLRSLVGKMIGRASAFQREASNHLEPLIEERKKMLIDYGSNWIDKPNDVLMWLMEGFNGNSFDSADVQSRILTVNSATSHTSSYTFMQALVNMASRPECMKQCIAEAETAVRCRGWTRDGINSLELLDSFFKESMRMNGLASMSFPRKLTQPLTLSDGTYLPANSFVSASFAAHFDGEYYENPLTFNAFRFPGRFLVAYALKALMAHILLNYDLRLGGDGARKPDFWFSYHCTPNTSTRYV